MLNLAVLHNTSIEMMDKRDPSPSNDIKIMTTSLLKSAIISATLRPYVKRVVNLNFLCVQLIFYSSMSQHPRKVSKKTYKRDTFSLSRSERIIKPLEKSSKHLFYIVSVFIYVLFAFDPMQMQRI